MKERRSLLLSRMANGFGDWIMLTAVMQMFNNARPDINLDLLVREHNPTSLLMLPALCGVRYRLVDRVTDTYDWYCPHVVYPNPRPTDRQTLTEGMLRSICAVSSAFDGILYDPGVRVTPMIQVPVNVPDRPYCIMPSAGRGYQVSKIDPRYAHSLPKEWEGMSRLSDLISRDYPIVQVGLRGDPALHGATMAYFDLPFESLSYLFKRAQFVVSLENGLSHWAGHHNKRCYTLYKSPIHAKPEHVWYPTQVPIFPTSAEQVYDTITQWEGCTGHPRIQPRCCDIDPISLM